MLFCLNDKYCTSLFTCNIAVECKLCSFMHNNPRITKYSHGTTYAAMVLNEANIGVPCKLNASCLSNKC